MSVALHNPPHRTIRLYGEMGRLFGRVHTVRLDNNSAVGAMQFLTAQFPRMSAYLAQARDRGIGFAVFYGKRNLGRSELEFPSGSEDIRVAPILMASKNGGVFQIILGVILIAASFIPFLAPIAPYLVATGISMIAGGVIQLLTPIPKGSGSRDNPANTPSYTFNGPVNTEAQGHPVPIIYGGPMKVGSAVISAGIDVKDTSASYIDPSTTLSTSGGGGGGGDLTGVRNEVQ